MSNQKRNLFINVLISIRDLLDDIINSEKKQKKIVNNNDDTWNQAMEYAQLLIEEQNNVDSLNLNEKESFKILPDKNPISNKEIKISLAIDWLGNNYKKLDLKMDNIQIRINSLVIKPQQKYNIDLTTNYTGAYFVCTNTANVITSQLVTYAIEVMLNYLISGTIKDNSGLFDKEIGHMFKS